VRARVALATPTQQRGLFASAVDGDVLGVFLD